MFTIALVALIRLIPYGFIAVNAWTKGYRWLTIAGVWLFGVAIFNYVVNPDGDLRAVLAMITAFFLTMHALDLKPKQRR